MNRIEEFLLSKLQDIQKLPQNLVDIIYPYQLNLIIVLMIFVHHHLFHPHSLSFYLLAQFASILILHGVGYLSHLYDSLLHIEAVDKLQLIQVIHNTLYCFFWITIVFTAA